ncbi:MAG: hypothetical protein K9H16_15265 [Bacteroidales bacterium]|nr:hypothetical protein [Bacteroidales bacterium]
MLKAIINFKNYRWAARITGFIGLVLIISFMLGQGFEMIKSRHASYDLLFLLTVFSFSFFAYIIGWIIEIVGGSLLTLSGIAIAFFVSFSEAFSGIVYVLLLSLPILIPGIFYLMSWRHKVIRMQSPS